MAVDEDGRRITFAGYAADVETAAAGLAAMGLAEGDVVSWQLPTWIESLVLVGALARLGVTQNPIHSASWQATDTRTSMSVGPTASGLW